MFYGERASRDGLFGDAVRDLLDPRLRGGGGRLDVDASRLD